MYLPMQDTPLATFPFPPTFLRHFFAILTPAAIRLPDVLMLRLT